ncbi:DEAD/DEAH box helicase [Winogradskyella undariae]|uniref:DEAD/DEAH box helicase n=1 Tax=Winogradskyella TaxID=286104 RepID=UPI00156B41B0|nr:MULTISPECIES: DEAD/DEAH box helicase [Winogradskyella]NRR92933.1 DEAD/DEAH box helicase [Winogradskyella undariae]QXP79109.1 DEAD/DEAH box helicase [Winogradskyella sp. HaHa_3_26]
MKTFSELGIKKSYIKGLKELNIVNPTEIQEKVIPILLESKTDLIGLAQTGTGKTAAFGLPVLHSINTKNSDVQALIIAPTRELVQQIQKQLFRYTKYIDEKIFSEGVYGGEKMDKQIKALTRTTHIVVATPGRLLDLVERGAVDISNVKTLILDEADEMLSMGFKEDLNKILAYNTKKRNTWLFSATMPEEIKRIVNTYMSPNAIKIEVNKNALVNENISHHYIHTNIKEKLNMIIRIIDKRQEERGIIFCRTKAGTKALALQLKNEGFAVDALEGDMQQKDRDKVMRAFKNETLQILVSTDVSARGIDVNNLGFVLHHQLPEQLDYYTHRSGRTARAGKTGQSIALIIPGEMQKVIDIQSALGITFRELAI